jgi:hypothetical protein
VTGVRSDGQPLNAPYPQGTTTITWTATDFYGKTSLPTSQMITVDNMNVLDLNLAFCGVFAPAFTRCITIELRECPTGAPVTVTQDVVFTAGTALHVPVLVPCGNYTCISARDPLHSLRRTLTAPPAFQIVGTQYVADFTGTNCLVCGNLNNDIYVDILDFGTMVSQWARPMNPNTPCGTPPPHSDINGDGLVGLADFSFIQINFLKRSDPDCCSTGMESVVAPVTRISLGELSARGLQALAVADLNRDGWLDVKDVLALMSGTQPMPTPVPVAESPEMAPSAPVRR